MRNSIKAMQMAPPTTGCVTPETRPWCSMRPAGMARASVLSRHWLISKTARHSDSAVLDIAAIPAGGAACLSYGICDLLLWGVGPESQYSTYSATLNCLLGLRAVPLLWSS